jgi:glutamate formiminotransferase
MTNPNFKQVSMKLNSFKRQKLAISRAAEVLRTSAHIYALKTVSVSTSENSKLFPFKRFYMSEDSE